MSEALISISPNRTPPPGKLKFFEWRGMARKLVENDFWNFSPPPPRKKLLYKIGYVIQRRPQWKTTSMEDDVNGRRCQ